MTNQGYLPPNGDKEQWVGDKQTDISSSAATVPRGVTPEQAERAATLTEPSWIARCSDCGHPTAAAMYGLPGTMPFVRRWIARGDDVDLGEAEAFRGSQTCECKRA